MKHAFRFIWWGFWGAIMLGFAALLYTLVRFFLYPLWTFKVYRESEHPDFILWHEVTNTMPLEIWQRMIDTWVDPDDIASAENDRKRAEKLKEQNLRGL